MLSALPTPKIPSLPPFLQAAAFLRSFQGREESHAKQATDHGVQAVVLSALERLEDTHLRRRLLAERDAILRERAKAVAAFDSTVNEARKEKFRLEAFLKVGSPLCVCARDLHVDAIQMCTLSLFLSRTRPYHTLLPPPLSFFLCSN